MPLVCTIEMSKEAGVTITVVNADGKITQTVTMDGTTLTLEVAGEEQTSSFTQTAEAIAITCKDFSVTASNSIVCTASKTLDLTTEDQDMTLSSGAKLSCAVTGDFELDASNASIAASSAAKLEGSSVTASASAGLTLEGGSEAKLSGPSVTVSADGTLSVKSSGVATLEGSMTNIKGSLIKAG